MQTGDWLPEELERRVRELLALPADERRRELDALCRAEPQHANAIEMLAALEAFAFAPASDPGPAASPEHVGPYRIVRVLGEGGMGTVYLAEQEVPLRRLVALKLVKLGMDSRQVLLRFEGERQALACMAHSNIARVLDGGLSDAGRPYFVMEYVDGEPITRFCERHGLGLEARIELFQQVCAGVQHAHQKGVLHRDLKPSNILVQVEDGAPRAKIIDFGLARAIDREHAHESQLTVEGQLLGTPAYMSPEQAAGDPAAIDTRSDVYSLGVVLYQLLVGRLPFEQSPSGDRDYSELRRRIRDEDPAKPSSGLGNAAGSDTQQATWLRRLRGDLDWIVLRCLEKGPDQRYGSPAALAADLGRYLESEVVEARPPSQFYRLRKLVRRHRAAFVSAALVFVVLVGGVVGTGIGLHSALAANEQLAEQRHIADQKTADAESALARATEVKRVLVEMLTLTNPLLAQGRDTALLRLVLDTTAARLFDGSIVDPSIRIELHAIVARVYFNLTAWDEVGRHCEALVELFDATAGEHSPQVLEAVVVGCDLLGQVALQRDDYDRAAAYIARAEAIDLPPGETVGLEIRLLHAHLLQKRGRRAEALAMLRRTAADARELLSPDDPLLFQVARQLGPAECAAGNIDAGHAAMREATRLCARQYGERSVQVGLMLASELVQLRTEGRYAEALEVAEQAHRIFVAGFGADSPRTRGLEGAMASLLSLVGRYEEALPLAQRTYEVELGILGPNGANAGDSANTMAVCYSHLDRVEDAVALYRKIVPSMVEACGEGRAVTLRNRVNLATMLQRDGQLEAAEREFTTTVEHARAGHGDADPLTFEAELALGRFYLETGRPARARPLLEHSFEGRRQAFGADAADTRESRELLDRARAAGDKE
ncbi:MAG: serine/threonine protein kinase [Planctomycetes bacterium]|nr:serine/threonine protein kinase [Planctomycetota bacterium]